jgi:arginyl-tRNA synthetase
MNFKTVLLADVKSGFNALYDLEIPFEKIQFQETRPEFEGELTLTVFSLIVFSKKSPENTAKELGKWLVANSKLVHKYNVVKGFLNLSLRAEYWFEQFQEIKSNPQYGFKVATQNSPVVMIEYPSPNTNKPLHLGHLRNIFLGSAISEILKANGNDVVHSCLYNDRGTNISKSMLAWMKWGNGETPENSEIKGDHLVGDYYVKFSDAYKAEVAALIATGLTKEEAEKASKLTQEVNELTVKWEEGDKEVRALWSKMNGWVYQGFEQTYAWLGIRPQKFYYESDVYNLGKETVQEGLEKGVFFKKEDGSIWIDLTQEGLDQKVVLRSNGTTVYITQDIAIANEKERDFNIGKSIYVVGNEQEYHFKVLFLILKKLGRKYADNLFHLSYGMVELPTGKMKSREGTVVDADDLIAEMLETAKNNTLEKGKTEGYSEAEIEELNRMVALGALRYFILKVDPKKKMIFNPAESIETEGHTGPFIQYAYARIKSLERKHFLSKTDYPAVAINSEILLQKEIQLIKTLSLFPEILEEAGITFNPSLVANYAYNLAKEFNQYYHEIPVFKENNYAIRNFRVELSSQVALVIHKALKLLCIEVPERM